MAAVSIGDAWAAIWEEGVWAEGVWFKTPTEDATTPDTHDGGRDYYRRGRDRDEEFKKQREQRRGLRDELVALYTGVRTKALETKDGETLDTVAGIVAEYTPTSAPDLPLPTQVDWDAIVAASRQERQEISNKLKLLAVKVNALEIDTDFNQRAAILLLLAP